MKTLPPPIDGGTVGVIASGEQSPTEITVDDAGVYWVAGGQTIRRCDALDCANGVAELAANQGDVRGIATYGVNVYWASVVQRSVMKCARTGCASSPGAVWTTAAAYDVAVSAAGIFWTYSAGAYSCSLVGCGGAPAHYGGAEDRPQPIALTDTHVLFADWAGGVGPGYLMRCPHAGCVGGGNPQKVANTSAVPVIATQGNRVFWATHENQGQVQYCSFDTAVDSDPLCDGAEIITLATGQQLARAIAVDATSVYWTNRGDGTVRRCAISGCGGVPEVLAQDQGEPYGLALDATHVYWTNFGDGRVMRIAK